MEQLWTWPFLEHRQSAEYAEQRQMVENCRLCKYYAFPSQYHTEMPLKIEDRLLAVSPDKTRGHAG
jgi:hypothetical protein